MPTIGGIPSREHHVTFSIHICEQYSLAWCGMTPIVGMTFNRVAVIPHLMRNLLLVSSDVSQKLASRFHRLRFRIKFPWRNFCGMTVLKKPSIQIPHFFHPLIVVHFTNVTASMVMKQYYNYIIFFEMFF